MLPAFEQLGSALDVLPDAQSKPPVLYLQRGRSMKAPMCPVPSRSVLISITWVIATLFTGSAPAQEWPTRPLTMVAPFAAGGSTDAIAQIVADGLSIQLKQTVIVENVGGAGGMTGANRVAKATPDGYQFVLGNVGTHAQNQSLYKKPLYNAVSDFAPVALVTDQSLILVTRKSLPANSLQEFISYAKANQSKLQYGSAGLGRSNHLACVLLNTAIGIQVTHVPYRGGLKRCKTSWLNALIINAQALQP